MDRRVNVSHLVNEYFEHSTPTDSFCYTMSREVLVIMMIMLKDRWIMVVIS